MLGQFFTEKYYWISKIIIGLVLLFVLPVILSYVLKLIKHKADIKRLDWKKNVYAVFNYPIKNLIWIFVISYILSVMTKKFNLQQTLIYVNLIRNVAIVICITWLFIKWTKEFQKQIIIKWNKQVDRTTVEFIGKIFTFIIIFISFLLILQFLGLNIMPLIAFGGVGAAAFAFAAKDVIANLFSGIMLHLTRPFVKGEIIEIPSQNINGIIQSINWYNTCIQDSDKILIYVPNSIFTSIAIKNSSRRTHRKFEETLKIKYSDYKKINLISEDIKKSFSENKFIDQTYDISVFLTNFSEYYLNVNIKAYTYLLDDKDFFQFKQNALMEIKSIFEKHDAEMAFPTTSHYFLNKPAI
ncbi:MAG: mechanosensitive ion channel domain-containing protein [Parachlamydiales bacterium]|jgi:MscS family membrane protein